VIPSLVVLHDLSAWFVAEMESSSHVLSHYVELIAMGLDCTRYFSQLQPDRGNPVKLALIDGKLCDLRLPVVDRTPKKNDKKASMTTSATTSSDDGLHTIESVKQTLDPLLPIIAKYFEWIGQVEKYSAASPSGDEEQDSAHPAQPMRKMTLCRSTLLSGMPPKLPEEHVFHWREDRAELGEFSTQKATTITHF